MSTTLLICAALAVLAALAYVLYPIAAAGRRKATVADTVPRVEHVTVVTDDEIEAAVSAYRAAHVVGDRCSLCGPRPESDAVFCSNCGRRLVVIEDSAARGDATSALDRSKPSQRDRDRN
jgi:hypothetical protein